MSGRNIAIGLYHLVVSYPRLCHFYDAYVYQVWIIDRMISFGSILPKALPLLQYDTYVYQVCNIAIE